MLLHLFAVLVAASTAVLIFAGGMVTSTGSGLSVPDWPNTYGWFMFSFPLEHWVGGIFYEHTHRLIASTVGLPDRRAGALALARRAATLGATARLHRARRRSSRRACSAASPCSTTCRTPISIAHASLAQIVFCLTVTIALVTSPGWKRASARVRRSPRRTTVCSSAIALVTTAAVYLQILVGATMRHTDAGLAIPDFPLAFGQLIPPHWDSKIAVHFAHRVGALVVSLLILATTAHVLVSPPTSRRRWPAAAALLLSAAGNPDHAWRTHRPVSGKHHIINSLHVVTGASVLATSLVLTLRAHRARFASCFPKTRCRELARLAIAPTGPAASDKAAPLGSPARPRTGARA